MDSLIVDLDKVLDDFEAEGKSLKFDFCIMTIEWLWKLTTGLKVMAKSKESQNTCTE